MFNPYVELILVSVIFGFSGVFVKILHLPATTLSFFRLAVPTIVLYIYLTTRKVKLFRGNIKFLLIASFLNAFRLLLYFMAFTLASVGNATLASSVGPVFLVLYEHMFFKKRISRLKLFLLIISLVGVCILYASQTFSFTNKDFLGMTLAIISSAIYNLTVIIFEKELKRYSKMETVFYQNVVGAFLFLPFLFINTPFPALWQISLASIYGGFIVGVIGFVLFFSAIKRVSSSSASLAMLDGVLSVALGILLFKEHLSLNMIVGGTLITVASIYITREF